MDVVGEHGAELVVLGAAFRDPELLAEEAEDVVLGLVEDAAVLHERDLAQPPARELQGEELGERRQRVARLAVDGLPEGVGAGGRRAAEQGGHAEAPGGSLHRVEEGAEILDVVADVRDEGDVDPQGLVAGPGRLDHADVVDAMLGHALGQHGAHGLGWLDGDHLAGVEGKREGVATSAGANVEHGVFRSHEGAEGVEGGVARASRVGAEPGGDRRVEVAARGEDEAVALDLFAVGAHARGPRLDGVRRGGAKGVAHGRRVAYPAGSCQTERLSRSAC